MEWEIVMGLEVHTELATKTKIFCGCSTEFGGAPNTHVCEICAGLPGTLPLLNRRVVEFAVRTGLATNCEITRKNKFDRKNYFYPDLPKAYQISQLYLPICRNGYIEVKGENGEMKKIGIHEIHMEEDAGKLVHDAFEDCTLVDYNRCGVPLLEIVSEPDFRSAAEVLDYLEKLRAILQFTGVSDCKMQEGSLRADVNLSVRPKGQAEFGTRTEMKNLNSFRAIERAISYEARRQIELLEDGEQVVQETRRWDDNKGISYAMRSKEDAQDYKYFPEPDLPPIEISEETIAHIRDTMPELPEQKKQRYIAQLGLPEYDTSILTSDKAYVSLFEDTLALCDSPKDVANWIMGEVMKLLNDTATLPENMTLQAKDLAAVIHMVKSGKINRGTGKTVLEKVFTEGVDPEKYVADNNLAQITDLSALRPVIEEVIAANEKSVSEYKSGKTQAMGYIMGQAMRALKGKAPAQEVQKILHELLDS